MTKSDPDNRPFWQRKTLSELSPQEWESLCDGCAKCCLNKLEDVETGEIFATNVACRLLDLKSCRCRRYAERARWVADCVIVTPDNIAALKWMPSSCAYRLLAEGKPLPDWHPLVSKDPHAVHDRGISVRGRVISERDAKQPLEHYQVDWPL